MLAKAKRWQTYAADEPLEQNQICLQLLDSKSQLVLTHLALLQVLQNKLGSETSRYRMSSRRSMSQSTYLLQLGHLLLQLHSGPVLLLPSRTQAQKHSPP